MADLPVQRHDVRAEEGCGTTSRAWWRA